MKKDIVKITISSILLIIANFTTLEWLRIGLFFISYLIISYKVFFEVIKNIKKEEFFSEKFLMSISTIGAFAIEKYSEAIAVMLFFQIGEMFEEYAEEKSKKSIKNLMDFLLKDFLLLKNMMNLKKK